MGYCPEMSFLIKLVTIKPRTLRCVGNRYTVMIKITQHRGFHLKFENGLTISVQFGPMMHCEHHNLRDIESPENSGFWESKDAEIAIWDEDGPCFQFDNGDIILGYVNSDQLAVIG